jgi:hypothetical protein
MVETCGWITQKRTLINKNDLGRPHPRAVPPPAPPRRRAGAGARPVGGQRRRRPAGDRGPRPAGRLPAPPPPVPAGAHAAVHDARRGPPRRDPAAPPGIESAAR